MDHDSRLFAFVWRFYCYSLFPHPHVISRRFLFLVFGGSLSFPFTLTIRPLDVHERALGQELHLRKRRIVLVLEVAKTRGVHKKWLEGKNGMRRVQFQGQSIV